MSESRLYRLLVVLVILSTLTLPAFAGTRSATPKPARIADIGSWTGIAARLWQLLAGGGQEKEGSSVDPHGAPGANTGPGVNSAAGEEGVTIDPHG